MKNSGRAHFHGYLDTRVPKDGRIKKAGYCALRVKKIERCSARWFRLRGNLLFYLKGPEPWYEPLGVIVLGNHQITVQPQDENGHWPFRIVWENGVCYRMATFLESERILWLKAMEHAPYEQWTQRIADLHQQLNDTRTLIDLRKYRTTNKIINDFNEVPLCELSLSCDNLLCDGNGNPPSAFAAAFVLFPEKGLCVRYCCTEVVERCSNPTFARTIMFRASDGITSNELIRIAVYDIREQVTMTGVAIGSVSMLLSHIQEAQRLRVPLLTVDDKIVGFVTVNGWSLEPSHAGSSPTHPNNERNFIDLTPKVLCHRRSQSLPPRLGLKLKYPSYGTLIRLNFVHPHQATYRFHSGLGGDITVHESLSEPRFCFTIPLQLVEIYLRHEKELLEAMLAFAEITRRAPPCQLQLVSYNISAMKLYQASKKAQELFNTHMAVMKMYQKSKLSMINYTNTYYKTSMQKVVELPEDADLGFVPINLHLQRMWVHNDTLNKTGFHDVMTVGAFSAHNLVPDKPGGLIRLLQQCKDISTPKAEMMANMNRLEAEFEKLHAIRTLRNATVNLMQKALLLVQAARYIDTKDTPKEGGVKGRIRFDLATRRVQLRAVTKEIDENVQKVKLLWNDEAVEDALSKVGWNKRRIDEETEAVRLAETIAYHAHLAEAPNGTAGASAPEGAAGADAPSTSASDAATVSGVDAPSTSSGGATRAAGSGAGAKAQTASSPEYTPRPSTSGTAPVRIGHRITSPSMTLLTMPAIRSTLVASAPFSPRLAAALFGPEEGATAKCAMAVLAAFSKSANSPTDKCSMYCTSTCSEGAPIIDVPPTIDITPIITAPSSDNIPPTVDSTTTDLPPEVNFTPTIDLPPTVDFTPAIDLPPAVDFTPTIDLPPAVDVPPSYDIACALPSLNTPEMLNTKVNELEFHDDYIKSENSPPSERSETSNSNSTASVQSSKSNNIGKSKNGKGGWKNNRAGKKPVKGNDANNERNLNNISLSYREGKPKTAPPLVEHNGNVKSSASSENVPYKGSVNNKKADKKKAKKNRREWEKPPPPVDVYPEIRQYNLSFFKDLTIAIDDMLINVVLCLNDLGRKATYTDDEFEDGRILMDLLVKLLDEAHKWTRMAHTAMRIETETTNCTLEHATLRNRRDTCFSQALTTVSAGLMCWLTSQPGDVVAKLIQSGLGPLCGFEGLLSLYALEKTMWGDMVVAVEDLHTVTFQLIKITSSTSVIPQVTGHRNSIVVELPVTEALYARFDNCQQKPTFTVTAVFFNMGINEKASIADALGESRPQYHSNSDNLERLLIYYHKYNKVFPSDPMEPLRASSRSKPLEEVMENLRAEVAKRSLRNVEVLQLAALATRTMHGLRFISCKSAKDRTGMAVTLEQVNILSSEYHLADTDRKSALDIMRSEGCRRENTLKNVGLSKYAFSKQQVASLPEEYRPPMGSYGTTLT